LAQIFRGSNIFLAQIIRNLAQIWLTPQHPSKLPNIHPNTPTYIQTSQYPSYTPNTSNEVDVWMDVWRVWMYVGMDVEVFVWMLMNLSQIQI
jgi:hypothetical protein